MSEQKPLTTKRQQVLARVVTDCFKNYEDRSQPYFGLEGMTTAHITLHAIGDFESLKEFWPAGQVRQDRLHGPFYELTDTTMTKVQSSVRECLEQLTTKGYLLKQGNVNERRWLLIKPKKVKQTRVAVDPDNKRIGEYTRFTDDEPWKLVLDAA